MVGRVGRRAGTVLAWQLLLSKVLPVAPCRNAVEIRWQTSRLLPDAGVQTQPLPLESFNSGLR